MGSEMCIRDRSSVNSFGEITVAGNSAAANIEGFVYVAMNSLYQAAISFTGQNVGAGKYERVNRILYTAEACVIVVGLVLGNGALFFGRQLLSIYTENPAVIDTGMKRMNVIARTYALCGMMDVMVGSLRGCLLYTSDAADEEDSVDLGGRRIIKKKKKKKK